MKIALHPGGQYEVATHPARFRVICAGRRWGKSVLARMIMFTWAVDKPGLYWIVAPTYQQGQDIHWYQGYKNEIPPEYIEKWNDSKLYVDIKVIGENNQQVGVSRIQVKTAEKPDQLVGVKLSGLVVDEIAVMRNWDYIWEKSLRATLSDYKAPCVFISTPRGYNHFYDLFMKGQIPNKTYKSWRFTSYDNPHIPKEEIDQAKDDLLEDYFHQEYLADFRKYTGLVYKDFDKIKHVKQLEFNKVYNLRGLDRGFRNPTASPIVLVDKEDTWYVIDEIYQTELTNPELYKILVERKERYGIKEFEYSTADSAQASDIQELSDLGEYFISVNKNIGESRENYVRYKIQKLSERIRKGKLFIHPRCTKTIEEFENYRWKEKKNDDANEIEQPEKSNDHMMDALGDLNCMYEHYFKEEKDPYGIKDKLPGTYIKPSSHFLKKENGDFYDEGTPISESW
jgi:uncharacterized protein (DUF2461 family)